MIDTRCGKSLENLRLQNICAESDVFQTVLKVARAIDFDMRGVSRQPV